MTELVTVIIPVYNRPAMLAEAVDSALAQTHRAIEIIVVDDGSTDETPETIRDLIEQHPERLRSLRINNAGPGAAREAGRQAARGEFIQYLDSDDLLYPDKLALQVDALRAHPDAGIAYGRAAYRIGERVVTEFPGKRCNERIGRLFPALLESRWWTTPTPLYRASIDVTWSDLRQEEDWEFESRVAIANPLLIFVDQLVVEIRHHDEARSSAGDATAALRMQERARARLCIYQNALTAGFGHDCEAMQHFGRATFLLGRQCGAAGLVDEARQLVALSGRIGEGVRGIQPAVFSLVARLAGWQRAGRWATRLDRLRS